MSRSSCWLVPMVCINGNKRFLDPGDAKLWQRWQRCPPSVAGKRWFAISFPQGETFVSQIKIAIDVNFGTMRTICMLYGLSLVRTCQCIVFIWLTNEKSWQNLWIFWWMNCIWFMSCSNLIVLQLLILFVFSKQTTPYILFRSNWNMVFWISYMKLYIDFLILNLWIIGTCISLHLF